MANDKALRDHLLNYIDWDNAHLKFDDAVNDFPPAIRGNRPEGGPHSAWELLEHLRIAQWDILEFTRDPNHVSPKFPDGYWPATEARPPKPPGTRVWLPIAKTSAPWPPSPPTNRSTSTRESLTATAGPSSDRSS